MDSEIGKVSYAGYSLIGETAVGFALDGERGRANLIRMKIELELPNGIFSALRLSPDEFSRELLLAAASKWYEAGLLSQERAAELAGCSRADFMSGLARFQVSPFQESAADLSAAEKW